MSYQCNVNRVQDAGTMPVRCRYVLKTENNPCVSLAIKASMISFKVSELDLIALKRNSVKILDNTIVIVVIAKGTQGM